MSRILSSKLTVFCLYVKKQKVSHNAKSFNRLCIYSTQVLVACLCTYPAEKEESMKLTVVITLFCLAVGIGTAMYGAIVKHSNAVGNGLGLATIALIVLVSMISKIKPL